MVLCAMLNTRNRGTRYALARMGGGVRTLSVLGLCVWMVRILPKILLLMLRAWGMALWKLHRRCLATTRRLTTIHVTCRNVTDCTHATDMPVLLLITRV